MANENFQAVDLDSTLDDIEDLPQFLVFPTGAYICILKSGIEDKTINTHPAFTVELELKEIVEIHENNLDKPQPDGSKEQPPKAGDISNLVFMRDNPTGAGMFKDFAAPIATSIGSKSFRDLMQRTTGMEVLIVTKRTYDKAADKYYLKHVKVAVL